MATLLASTVETMPEPMVPSSPLPYPAGAHGWELREDQGGDGLVRYGVYLNGNAKVLGLGHRGVAMRVLRRLASVSA